MKSWTARNIHRGRRALLGIAAMLAATNLIAPRQSVAQSVAAPASQNILAQSDWQTAAGGKMAFEVAAVRPSTGFTRPSFPLDAGNAFTPTGGRFSANFSLMMFINFAYKITPTSDQRESMLAHLPKWVETDTFAVEAKGPSNTTKDQFRLMMQSLLADRFKLEAHFETRQARVFTLTLVKPGKLGPNLRPHSQGPPCPGSAELPPSGEPPNTDVFPAICEAFAMTSARDGSRFLWGSRNSTLASLASNLPNSHFQGPTPHTQLSIAR